MGPIVIIYNETHRIDSERILSAYQRNDVIIGVWACSVIYLMNACFPSLKTLIVLHPTSSNLNRGHLYLLRIVLSLPLRVFHLTQSLSY